jgi:hypothetical protein
MEDKDYVQQVNNHTIYAGKYGDNFVNIYKCDK